MKKNLILIILISLFVFSPYLSVQSQNEEKTPVIREGKKVRNTVVAVDGYFLNNIFEVAVEVRMYSERPRITNVLIVGPKLGRLPYKRKEEIPLKMEEREAYSISEEGGVVSFGKKTKTTKTKGTLNEELFKFEIPWDKIVPGKKYQLWVDVESKSRGGDRPQKFRFDIKDFAQFAN